MKRILVMIIAAVAVAVVGMTSANAVTPASPRTNAAAVAHVKKILRFVSNHQVIRMYKALAPKQHSLLTQKKFVKCEGPFVHSIQSDRITKVLAVRTSHRTKIPGYRGKRILNKRVIFNEARKVGGKVHHRTNVFFDVAYVKGAFHWWLTHSELVICRGA